MSSKGEISANPCASIQGCDPSVSRIPDIIFRGLPQCGYPLRTKVKCLFLPRDALQVCINLWIKVFFCLLWSYFCKNDCYYLPLYNFAGWSWHFNENSNCDQAVTKQGKEQFDIVFPKYKKGGYIVRKVTVYQTYGKTC